MSALGEALAHESARLHVCGEAAYADDLPEPRGLLHAAFGLATRAHARIAALDLSAVAAFPGVIAVMSAADLPGENTCGFPGQPDPILAAGEVVYHGQPVFMVAATSAEAARRAVRCANIDYVDLPALLTIDAALAAESFLSPSVRVRRGEPEAAIARAPQRRAGCLRIGGQEHFYLEGQIALAIPREAGQMLIVASTQDPGDIQHKVAHALDLAAHDVVVECRRLGGAFGGKETQAAQFACAAAILARRCGRAVKFRVDRDADMTITGKRHDFRIDYEVGFDADGRILGARFELASRCGHSADLSNQVADRALMHVDNCYFIEHLAIVSHRLRTHTQSNTAFRGFGGPQGMMAAELVIDEIARALGRDPLDVRRINFYGVGARDITPYSMQIEDNIIEPLCARLEASADYRARRAALVRFNRTSAQIKRGLALVPIKFGISFTSAMFNQAGALVQLYTDGTVLLNHGGTEMGQGLFTKVAQVVASELGIDVARVRVSAADTSKVPNASATAASIGSDVNGKAAQDAARTLRTRLADVAAAHFGTPVERVRFAGNRVHAGAESIEFATLARLAWAARVPLSATGFYKTPKIRFDLKAMRGRPYYYFAYGAAAAEVAIDTLTGETRVLRVDILHDAGRSLNPAIDIGQIEGGFIQGMGLVTSEELCWDPAGRLTTHAPSTYKIPTAGDTPIDFRVAIYDKGENVEDSIFRSKAVGEPPLMLAIAVFQAIRDAVAAASGTSPRLDSPATPERILRALTDSSP